MTIISFRIARAGVCGQIVAGFPVQSLGEPWESKAPGVLHGG